MQSIKQVTDSLSVCGLYELSVYLSVHIVRDSTDDPLPKWEKRFDLFFYIFFLRRTPRPQHATHAATPISRRHALRSLPYPPRCRPSWSYQSRLPDPSNLPVQSPPPISLPPWIHGRLPLPHSHAEDVWPPAGTSSNGPACELKEACMAALPTSDAKRNPDCASFTR
jgi:hypothetical protein